VHHWQPYRWVIEYAKLYTRSPYAVIRVCDATGNVIETRELAGMKEYSLRLIFSRAVMALVILTSCTAQTTHSTRVPEVKDRHNFRDEQEGAPRVDNAVIGR
jgi:hypothetical protein